MLSQKNITKPITNAIYHKCYVYIYIYLCCVPKPDFACPKQKYWFFGGATPNHRHSPSQEPSCGIGATEEAMGNYLSQSTADKSSISLLFWRFGVLAFWRFGVLALKNAGRGRKTVERIKWGGDLS